MKRIIQPVILVLGVVAMVYGIWKISSETTTVILPAWLIVGVVSLIVTGVSIAIGVLVKRLLNADWYSLTFASIIIIIIVGIYAVVAYKPRLNIVVWSSFSGEVKLIVSKEAIEKKEIIVDSFGVGYITRRDFDEGFYPRIIKGNTDITKEIKEYSKGGKATSPSVSYSLEFLSFIIPGQSNQLASDIFELIRVGAIDTMRLPENTKSALPN
jgi:hypothetical protein